jgi:hypothetical protein
MCLFCNCYFVCVPVGLFMFGDVVEGIGGRVLTLVLCVPVSWLWSYVIFSTGIRV